jgi:hypothetical protein
LQRQEDDAHEVSPEKLRDVDKPEHLGEDDKEGEMQEGEGVVKSKGSTFAADDGAEDTTATDLCGDPGTPSGVHGSMHPSPLGSNSNNGREYHDETDSEETVAMADTKFISQMSGLEDEDEIAEVEEQVDADFDYKRSMGCQAISPEAEPHVYSPDVDGESRAEKWHWTLQGDLLVDRTRRYGSPVDRKYQVQATSSLPPSALATLSLLDAEWTNSDDELLLDGDLIAHEELVRRKGLGSMKFRTAHLYGLLLDG